MQAKAIVVLTFLLFSISTAHAATQKVLYTFTGGVDGGQPFASVIFDSDGNLYGVTQTGGLYGKGTVFELTPSPSGVWTETVLYNFTGGTDGANPVGGLAIDDIGNLFGTTSRGGDPGTNCGTLFKLAGNRHFTVLHTFELNFQYSDGCGPLAKLFWVPGTPGALWGTTNDGAGYNFGAVFIFDLDGNTYSSYFGFTGKNGANIYGGLNEWGYGTTSAGGAKFDGDVYNMLPHVKVIHTFNEKNKLGLNPIGELLTANVGGVSTMYGTTSAGGVGGQGTVYSLSQGLSVWKARLLYSFSGLDGASPGAGVTADSAGNLYGTTTSGGTNPGSAGTVFELTPGAKKTWIQTVLYSFSGGADGGVVTSGVVFDNAGNLYGTTMQGGTFNQGVVYEVTP